jgi:signal transduction histidine kinase
MKMSMHLLEMTLQRENIQNDSSKKINQYLQILKNECEREISLINDLLDLQRLEAGKQALIFDTVQVREWVSEVVQGFYERAKARQIALQVDLPTQNLPPLTSDIASLERILAELLNNACKYTPPEGTIKVSAKTNCELLQLSVTNFGAEIPAAELARIFDKFYRVPNADPWKQGGTGLGLALVQRLAQHLAGTIRVESGAGQTTFIVEIPNQAVLNERTVS